MNTRQWITLTGIIIFIVFIVPIVVNSLINLPAKCDVIGNEIDWLAFHGSYLGGALGAIVAFLAILSSSKHNALNLQISNKEHYINDLEKSLADCVASVNFAKLGSASLWIGRKKEADEELKILLGQEISKLNDYWAYTTDLANKWGIVYIQNNEKKTNGKSKETSSEKFKEQYEICISVFNEDINEITDILCSFLANKIDFAELKSKTKDFVEKTIKQKENQQELFDNTQKWLKKEREELQELQDKTKRIFPDIEIKKKN